MEYKSVTMRIIFKYHSAFLFLTGIILTASLLLQACKKSDEFYKDLDGILQLAVDKYSYSTSYKIGDTIYFYGRFGDLDSDLRIHIGDADAQLTGRSYVNAVNVDYADDVNYDSRLQLVKVPVEEKMGVGPGRQVLFTLGQRSLQGTPIFIRKSGAAAVFSDTLLLKGTGFDFGNSDLYFIQSWNGSGNVFYFDYTNSNWNIWKNGITTSIPVALQDETDQFTITSFSSASIDKKEKHLFFCASTKNISTGETMQRFCKIDLATATLTTLNITSGSISSGPWEGNVASVKLPSMRFMNAGEDGRVYFHTGSRYSAYLTSAIGRMDADGNIVYLTGTLSGTTISNSKIVFSNPGGGSTVGASPNPVIFDADRNLLYHLASVETFGLNRHYVVNVYDFVLQREVGSFEPEMADPAVDMILDAPFEAAKFDQGGTWFLQEGKMVWFLTPTNARNKYPAAVVVDFESRETYTYAPYFEFHGVPVFDRTVLNYTPEGHVIFKRQYDFNSERDKYPLHTLEVSEVK